ncbi:MAG: HesA/MoeB/ThiF family protein [Methanomicrobiales archaeon]|nr:HesA/MoeB/ThiF family protein [Methanomicrobiales archaeon]
MLSDNELRRYSRQIPLIGEEGQKRLKETSIFIAGAGGLGCPVALYLAAAGVGRLLVADNDMVEESNLNRQILHYPKDIGRKKVCSMGEKLSEMNPCIKIEALDAEIDEKTVASLTAGADGIVDALDNFPTRYLLNGVALKRGIPLFHGAIHGFFGQATTIIPGRSPCLRCIFPHPPPEEMFPAIGAASGFIGLVLATEVLKYILGRGELLAGRLLIWDGWRGSAEEVPVMQNPACESCSGMKERGG